MPNVALIELITLSPYFGICVGLDHDGYDWHVWGKWTHLVDYL